MPESGSNSPYVKAGNPEQDVNEIASIFGSECWVKEQEQRRLGKQDTPNRLAVYLGESRDVPKGKKIAYLDYDEHNQLWIISKTHHKASKHVRIVNNNMVLKSRKHEESTALELEKFLDTTTKVTPIY